jgi:hypothetical protein
MQATKTNKQTTQEVVRKLCQITPFKVVSFINHAKNIAGQLDIEGEIFN